MATLGLWNMANAQLIVKDTAVPKFEWSYQLLEFPFMADAAQTESVRRIDGFATSPAEVKIRDYGHFYKNLSMTQATDMARNVHGSLYYGHNVLWNKLIKPVNTKTYILNRLVANVAALGTDYLAIKLPYAFAFQHEEFHRSVLMTRHIYSHDDVWDFGKGLDIAVSGVKDEDLIYLKKHFPADQVRLAAAGVEGEYVFMQRMREDNFFKQTGYPFLGISIVGTIHAVSYVNLPFTARFNDITDTIMSYDKDNVLARDFTGFDFSAWVYDLFTPDEPYDARGTWPGGIGIKRPIKESELTSEMKAFLRETGNMQYINFISPFMVGINRMQWKPGYYFNFALRSVPTSFGYYAGADVFLDLNNKQTLVSLGINRSKNLVLPSVQLKLYELEHSKLPGFKTHVKLSAWLQPKDQMFFAEKAQAGFLVGIQPSYALSKNVSINGDFSYKSKGWEFGHPYLDNNFTAGLGISIRTNSYN